jgi:hypothetical protein
MNPATVSASSLIAWLECHAKWVAQYFNGAREPSGKAAALGTVCHEVMEHWVKLGHHQVDWPDIESMMKAARPLYDHAYHKLFSDGDRYMEGLKLVRDWLERTDWSIRKVLHAEEKKRFSLQVRKNAMGEWEEQLVTYIFDRVDERTDEPYDGDIEVVDYKSYARPVSPEELKQRPQSRIYALAAQLEYPNAKRIWVTFDLLRFGQVSIVFSKEENRETYRWLREVVLSIWEADEATAAAEEELGEGCRYCVRRSVCGALASNLDAGGLLGILGPDDIGAAMEMQAKLSGQLVGVTAQLKEVDTYLDQFITAEQLDQPLSIGGYTLTPVAKATRRVDPGLAAEVVGPEMMAGIAKPGVTIVDEWIKDRTNGLTDEQRVALRKTISKVWGDIKPVVTKDKPFSNA